ncbi:MAG: hypothetical protein KJZ77_14150 [Anaerolineales bacterium]|nr:hypothetical protein [Anaerolineales bacterium]
MYRIILLIVFVALIVGINVYISVTPTQQNVFSRVSIVANVLLAGMCVIVLIGAAKSIPWSLAGLVVYVIWALINVEPPSSYGLIRSADAPYFLELNPGTYGMMGSIVGGIFGKYNESLKDNGISWARNGLLIGLVGSFCFMANELFMRSISGP